MIPALQTLWQAQRQWPVPAVEKRIQTLLSLRDSIRRHEAAILQALKLDLGKSPSEAWIELGGVLKEIELMVRELPAWALPEKVKTPMVLAPGKSMIQPMPYGVVLVLSPWNYPIQLSFNPLVGAIAAGNRVVLKPSEISAHTSRVIEQVLAESVAATEVAVLQGGADVTQQILQEKFDLIFFTGSTHVGKLVMKAAAEHLTPVVLELGGKSPCIVDETAHIAQAARRIVWGKFANTGQTCVAPDFVVVHQSVKEKLIHECREAILQFYGNNPQQSPDLGRIVSERHFDRLVKFLDGRHILHGGQHDRGQRFFAPTLIDQVDWEDRLMQEEIFGPILPFLSYENLDDVLARLRQRPTPLAFYLFSTNAGRQQEIMSQLQFGGGCINDTVMHLGNHALPFGGVGESGMGAYHGKYSFDVFSHKKAIYQQTTLVDIPVRYPPYESKEKLIKFLLG